MNLERGGGGGGGGGVRGKKDDVVLRGPARRGSEPLSFFLSLEDFTEQPRRKDGREKTALPLFPTTISQT